MPAFDMHSRHVLTAEAQDASAVVAGALGPGTRVLHAAALTEGASRRTTALLVEDGDGVRRKLVLQQGRADSDRAMATEAELMIRAAAAGVPAPAVLAASDDPDRPGAPYTLLEHVDGETRPQRIFADPALAPARAGLARRCGEVLAAVHRVPTGGLGLTAVADPLAVLRERYDATGAAVPTFELALRALARDRPPPRPGGLVHGDFRMGNLIVAPDGLAAVLDWELAHVGDPVEDLGWLCTKAWRFRQLPVVGGFGEVDDLLAGYRAGGGRPVERAELRWWMLYGTLNWGVICLTMLADHLRGTVRSVDRVAIGRRVAEQEWDLLDLLESPGEAL
jgi:aminoglycoside phosphotransferase (APT) family kinase protein